MVVVFSEGAFSCQITRAELDRLLSGRALTLDVALPRDHRLRVNVRPAALNGWQLDSDPTGLWLSIPRTELEAFEKTLPATAAMLRALDTSNGGSLQVTFEVEG